MASLYKRHGSPFFYLRYRKNGKWFSISTELRWDDEREAAQARVVRAEMEAKEEMDGVFGREESGAWDFVPVFLAGRSSNRLTCNRYLKSWEWIALFLQSAGIRHPREVRWRHGEEYVNWRTTRKKKTGKFVSRNTAILEAKVFSMILQRAVRLELCEANPLVKMELKKDAAKEKAVISNEEFDRILAALEQEEPWMETAFRIAMHTGCRLRETRIARKCIDLERETISFADPKGGKERAFTVPMPKQLVPLFQEFRASGRSHTLEFPFQPSRAWQQFFHRLGLDHLCFHCLRVTFITRMAAAGVSISVAMRLVNHASESVHRIYQKIQAEDLRPFAVGLSGFQEQSVSVATP